MKKLIFLLLLFINPNGLFSQWNLNNYNWDFVDENANNFVNSYADITLYFTVINNTSFQQFISFSENVLLDNNNYQYDCIEYSNNLPMFLFPKGKIDCWLKFRIPKYAENIKLYNGKVTLLVSKGYHQELKLLKNKRRDDLYPRIKEMLKRAESHVQNGNTKQAYNLLTEISNYNINLDKEDSELIKELYCNLAVSFLNNHNYDLLYKCHESLSNSLYPLQCYDSLIELSYIIKGDSLLNIKEYSKAYSEYSNVYKFSSLVNKINENIWICQKNKKDRFIEKYENGQFITRNHLDRNNIVVNNFKLTYEMGEFTYSGIIKISDSNNIEMFNASNLHTELNPGMLDEFISIDLDNDGKDEIIVTTSEDNKSGSYCFDFKYGFNPIIMRGYVADIVFEKGKPYLVLGDYATDGNYVHYLLSKYSNHRFEISNNMKSNKDFQKIISNHLTYLENEFYDILNISCESVWIYNKKNLIMTYLTQKYIIDDIKSGLEVFDNIYNCNDKYEIRNSYLKAIERIMSDYY